MISAPCFKITQEARRGIGGGCGLGWRGGWVQIKQDWPGVGNC